MIGRVGPGLVALVALAAIGCHDISRFSNSGDHYEGAVIAGDFLRAGFAANVSLCLVIDANHLQDAPGFVSSSDGRFDATPLRPIPQIWHDPLSTLAFGEGRVQNFMYVATPDADADTGGDVIVVMSLMQSGAVEARLLRGAPAANEAAGAAAPAASLFGVFTLSRVGGPCAF